MLVVFQSPALSPFMVFLIVSYLVASSSSSSSSSSTVGNDSHRINDLADDYDDYFDTTPSPTRHPVNPVTKRCDYDLCQDRKPSCQELAASTGCSCPGMTGPHEPPDPPHLRRLSQEASGGVVVHWCAPASTVTHFLVQVKGEGKDRKADRSSRQMNLGRIEAGTEVCVLAGNNMGQSDQAKQSCTNFQPQSSESELALKLGIIGGVVALIVVLALALLLWRLRRRRKTLARTGGANAVL